MYPHIIRVRCLRCLTPSSSCHAGRRRSSWRSIKQPTQITSGPLTHKIRIIRGRTDADGFCRATIEVTHVVYQILQSVSGILEGRLDFAAAEDLVEDDKVVCGPRGPLDHGMGLQETVPVPGFGNAAVDDSTVLRIRRAVGIFFAS